MFAPISIASAVIFYLYFVLMTKFLRQTLGKMVFGLKVVDLKKNGLSWGTVLFREWIGRFISVNGYCRVYYCRLSYQINKDCMIFLPTHLLSI